VIRISITPLLLSPSPRRSRSAPSATSRGRPLRAAIFIGIDRSWLNKLEALR
jgi:hypothetical protein